MSYVPHHIYYLYFIFEITKNSLKDQKPVVKDPFMSVYEVSVNLNLFDLNLLKTSNYLFDVSN